MFSKGKSRKKEFIFEIFRFNSVVKIKQNIINSRKIERIKRNVSTQALLFKWNTEEELQQGMFLPFQMKQNRTFTLN